ncbi:4-amino-4-deoxychorismate lyase [Idiomarina aquatica]|uniref:Aminodeoxychorismate lyase n=1 Tax=Idiomarina aquatica TaxID=1327752 RepID=A0A4R6PPX9_9GAMM|nr:aminodeoxychorismate lyase [Idiomarina aquatica]TDP40775.1 4-amino-4-deoxychorismate lyase [Idiomarina aquatica]
MIFCNGKQHHQPLDRGLQFGDGHFTTLRLHNGKPLWWDYHWQRLVIASQRLALPVPERQQVEAWLADLTAGQPDGVAKIIVTRGFGGRGYMPPAAVESNTYMQVSPLPPVAATINTVAVAELQLARQPVLAGLKTLNRLEQVLLAREREEKGVDDLLVLDHHNALTECCQGNIFWRSSDQWFTPSLQQAGVAGVARQVIIDQQWLGRVNQGVFTLEDLYQADQAFVCNSVRGAVPIKQLNGKVLSTDLPELLKQLTAC